MRPLPTSAKLTAIGNSLGIILPRESLLRLRAERGDTLHLLETPLGLLITPYDPLLAQRLPLVEEVARLERETLRALNEGSEGE